MKLFNFIAALSLVTLTACSTPPPTYTELKNADYGPYPTNYKQIIETKAKTYLVDEDSAKFKFSANPQRTWEDFESGRTFGYGVCVDVNAKNRMGGYTGYKTNYFVIKNDRVIYSEGMFCHQGQCLAPRKCR